MSLEQNVIESLNYVKLIFKFVKNFRGKTLQKIFNLNALKRTSAFCCIISSGSHAFIGVFSYFFYAVLNLIVIQD